jgi:hypothetical protein
MLLQYVPLALPFFLFLVGLFLFIVVLIQLRVTPMPDSALVQRRRL